MAFFSISRPQFEMGPNLGDKPNNGIKASVLIYSSLCLETL
jgi:hypothetical protein